MVGATPLALTFIEQNKNLLLQLKDLISNTMQPHTRMEELKNFISKFTSS